MEFIPHKYQEEGIKLIISKQHCGLFADMGTGKTPITLSALKILKHKGLLKRVLVIAPLRVAKFTWPDEIEKWDHLRSLSYTVLHGPKKDELLREATDISLINPEGLLWLLPILLAEKKFPFDMLIVDESRKFKSYSSKRFKLLKKVLSKFARRVILTGTPATNGLMDLFGQMFIVDQGLSLGSYITKFRHEFFYQDYNDTGGGWFLKAGSQEKIYERIQHKIMRVQSSSYFDLPIVFQDIKVELPLEALKLYKDMEKKFRVQVETKQVTAATAVTASMKCRQIASGFIYDDNHEATWIHEAKLEALDDLLEELEGKNVLIFYNFVEIADILRLRYNCPILGGTINDAQKQLLIDWNAGKVPLLAGHPASMGHGLNMQDGGHHIIWFDPTYDLEHYLQANARLHRQGQKFTVYVHRLLAYRTLDNLIVSRLEAKDQLQTNLLDALKAYWDDA